MYEYVIVHINHHSTLRNAEPEFLSVVDKVTDNKGAFVLHSLLIQYFGPLQTVICVNWQ